MVGKGRRPDRLAGSARWFVSHRRCARSMARPHAGGAWVAGKGVPTRGMAIGIAVGNGSTPLSQLAEQCVL